MANYVEKTKITAKKFVPVSSRYAESEVIYYTENKLLTFKTYKKKEIALTQNDKYFVVTPGTEFRPDLVSKSAYGSVDFWWKIMEVNNIKDIYDFRAGLNIRLPDKVLG